jgi:hypothetical protein
LKNAWMSEGVILRKPQATEESRPMVASGAMAASGEGFFAALGMTAVRSQQPCSGYRISPFHPLRQEWVYGQPNRWTGP